MPPKKTKPTQGGARPGAGRKAGESKQQVSVFAADVPALRRHGRTDALALRALLAGLAR